MLGDSTVGGSFYMNLFKILACIVSILLYKNIFSQDTSSCKQEKLIIAVAELNNPTKYDDPRIGRGITNMLISALLNTEKFRLVERNDEMLEKILEEQALSLTGLIKSSTAARVGKMLGAQAIVVGDISEFGIRKTNVFLGFGGKKTITTRVVVDVRMIDTETSEIIAAKTGIGESSTETEGAILTFEFGTEGFDETTIGIATRQAVLQISNKFASNTIFNLKAKEK